MQTIPSAEIKRQILMAADSSPVKKKMDQSPPGISEGEQVEWGNDLEAVTKMRGWVFIESYMMRRMNLVGLVMSDEKDSSTQKGVAKAFIELMQWIHLTIKRRDEILEKEKLKYEAKDVSQDEGE